MEGSTRRATGLAGVRACAGGIWLAKAYPTLRFAPRGLQPRVPQGRTLTMRACPRCMSSTAMKAWQRRLQYYRTKSRRGVCSLASTTAKAKLLWLTENSQKPINTTGGDVTCEDRACTCTGPRVAGKRRRLPLRPRSRPISGACRQA